MLSPAFTSLGKDVSDMLYFSAIEVLVSPVCTVWSTVFFNSIPPHLNLFITLSYITSTARTPVTRLQFSYSPRVCGVFEIFPTAVLVYHSKHCVEFAFSSGTMR